MQIMPHSANVGPKVQVIPFGHASPQNLQLASLP
jgi:hypothetical protein